jgi:hypothetical protein
MKIKVTTDGFGGEFVQGTLPNDTASYWKERGMEDLELHIVGDDIKDVPEAHYIHPWYEIDKIIHVSGIEMGDFNTITISNAETDEVLLEGHMMDEWVKNIAYVLNDEPIQIPDTEKVLTSMSIEKGSWEFEEFEDDQFDINKLKLILIDVDGTPILDHIIYNDERYVDWNGSTRGKEFRCYFSGDDATFC